MQPNKPDRMVRSLHQPDYQMEPLVPIMDVYADLSGNKLSGYTGCNETSPKGYAGYLKRERSAGNNVRGGAVNREVSEKRI